MNAILPLSGPDLLGIQWLRDRAANAAMMLETATGGDRQYWRAVYHNAVNEANARERFEREELARTLAAARSRRAA